MYVYKVKQKAIDLRKQGYSYSYISGVTFVPKTTLSDWLTNIPFKPNRHTINTIGKALAASGAKKHLIKVESLNKAKLQAEKDIKNISKRDLLMLGLGIYIGEGTKSNNITRIINSDPKIIKLAVRWFKEIFGVGARHIRVTLHLYPDNDERECINFWSKSTGIPANQFQQTSVDRRENKKISKRGKLKFGTAHVSVRSLGNKKFGVYLHRLILAWIDRVLW